MNRFIKAARTWDIDAVAALLDEDPKWRRYVDRGGRTGLHDAAARDTRKPTTRPRRPLR